MASIAQLEANRRTVALAQVTSREALQASGARFASLRDRPVADFADRDAPTLKPDSPLMEAVLLVYRTRNFVPVVDPASKHLIGVVSTWHILAQLEGSK